MEFCTGIIKTYFGLYDCMDGRVLVNGEPCTMVMIPSSLALIVYLGEDMAGGSGPGAAGRVLLLVWVERRERRRRDSWVCLAGNRK